MKTSSILILLLMLTMEPLFVLAAVSDSEAAKLTNELTPFGAERAGNADGTIPAWDGGLKNIPNSYRESGQHHPDPYKDDKILYTITKNNMADYSSILTDGLKALLRTYPDTFKIHVYPSHRSHNLPQWIYDNTYKNATSARLVEDGNGIRNAYGGIPFPIPQNGLEAIWNHITRYRGVTVDRTSNDVNVQRNGAYVLSRLRQEADFIYYQQDEGTTDEDNLLFLYRAYSSSPARLAGRAVLVHEPIDQAAEPRRAWVYNPGQRRVRRAATLSHDTPAVGTDGLRTVDDTDMYNGSPDRYDWKLVGKKEMLIPYNNYLLGSNELEYDDILGVGHINPDYARFELHRVWVVEANLKLDKRHVYAKRVFYLDEDSWSAALIDQYDGRGELWRVSIAYLKHFYDMPGVWTTLDIYHDLQARRYHGQGLDNEERSIVIFNRKSPGAAYYKPAALRRGGIR